MREERIVLRAEFDPKLRFYWWINGIFLCVVTVRAKVRPGGCPTHDLREGQEDGSAHTDAVQAAGQAGQKEGAEERALIEGRRRA